MVSDSLSNFRRSFNFPGITVPQSSNATNTNTNSDHNSAARLTTHLGDISGSAANHTTAATMESSSNHNSMLFNFLPPPPLLPTHHHHHHHHHHHAATANATTNPNCVLPPPPPFHAILPRQNKPLNNNNNNSNNNNINNMSSLEIDQLECENRKSNIEQSIDNRDENRDEKSIAYCGGATMSQSQKVAQSSSNGVILPAQPIIFSKQQREKHKLKYIFNFFSK